VHVTLKLCAGLPSLRRKDIYRALRGAVRRARLKGLRLVHFHLLSNHVHCLVECAGNEELSRGVQSLGTSLAKNINAAALRTGAVFCGRYHAHILKTPAEVRHALRYVLSNAAHHAAKHAASSALAVDAYSSLSLFVRDTAPHLKARLLRGFALQFPTALLLRKIEQELATLCVAPQTWLLRTGWQRTFAR
jgi:REP element-mobilizing transposase RayT